MMAWDSLLRNDFSTALAYAEKAEAQEPALPAAQLVLGRALVETGDVKSGIDLLEKELQHEPETLRSISRWPKPTPSLAAKLMHGANACCVSRWKKIRKLRKYCVNALSPIVIWLACAPLWAEASPAIPASAVPTATRASCNPAADTDG